MPFTPAHAAVVLPFKNKKYISFTGIVLGSMAPDFVYFIRFFNLGIGHTILGFFIINLPISFILAYVFHFIVKRSLIFNLPSPLDKNLSNIALYKWKIDSFKNVIIFIYSLFVGDLTHLFLDDFTHYDGYFVKKFPILSSNIGTVHIYSLLQYLTSFIGILIIVIFIFRFNRRNLNIEKNLVYIREIHEKSLYWIIVFLICFLWLIFAKKSLIYPFYFVVNVIDGICLGLIFNGILDIYTTK